jgi:multisubunit Na+/H+ antiporter MnhE subunit
MGILLSGRYNPPQLVEAAMLALAAGVFLLWWLRQDWPYLVLYFSYVIGAIASILVRETIAPSPHSRPIRFTALLSLIVLLSGVGFYTLRTGHLG